MISNSGRNSAISLLAVLLLVMMAFVAVRQMASPDVEPLNAPDTEFSSARALKHLEVIAGKPRPLGSPEHAAAREYIVGELRRMGLSPEIQNAKAINNIVVRLKGTGTGKAVLLVGHYDTVQGSPGASDDGSAVVSMLETLRALKAGSPLGNDVICLFSDGEEIGLRGAKAFVYSHPWAKDVGLVLNFEARGNSGPAVMFETSSENEWLIRQFAEAAPYPVANSLSYNIYKLLPNDTDLTVFIEAGMPGLNFAFMKGIDYYHSPQDSIENIDHRSLQHQGSYALALTRHFGNTNLEPSSPGNAVYFNTIGAHLVVYSEKWVTPLAALVSLLFAGVVWLGLKRRHLAASETAKGFAVVGLNIAASLVLVAPVWWALNNFASRGASTHDGDVRAIVLAVGAFIAVAVCYVLSLRKVSLKNLLAGGAAWWLILAWLTALLLPGGSYLFMWPLIFNLVALVSIFSSRQKENVSTSGLVVLALCALPGIILFAPIVYLSLIAFTLRSFLAVAVVVVPVVLIVASLVPHLGLINPLKKNSLP